MTATIRNRRSLTRGMRDRVRRSVPSGVPRLRSATPCCSCWGSSLSLALSRPRVDRGVWPTGRAAIAVNLALLGIFAAQHSIMARPAFKTMVDGDRAAGRRTQHAFTFVLAASAALGLLLLGGGATIDGTVGTSDNRRNARRCGRSRPSAGQTVLATTFASTTLNCSGLQRVSRTGGARRFAGTIHPLLYRLVRHPMMWASCSFWAAPM